MWRDQLPILTGSRKTCCLEIEAARHPLRRDMQRPEWGAVKTRGDIMRDHRRARTASVAALAGVPFVPAAGGVLPRRRAGGEWGVRAPTPPTAHEGGGGP